MKKLTLKQVDKIINRLGGKTEAATGHLLDKFGEEQPALFDYIHKADSRFNRDEADLLITMAVLGWHIVKKGLGRGSEVPNAFIEERFVANIELFDKKIRLIAKRKEKSPLTMLSSFNEQPELMAFLGRLIFDRLEGCGGPLRNKNMFPMVMHLKTLVDCLVSDPGKQAEGST